jgi:hypothetical protein
MKPGGCKAQRLEGYKARKIGSKDAKSIEAMKDDLYLRKIGGGG